MAVHFPSGSPLTFAQATVASFTTPEKHGQSVKYSPFEGNKLAVATGIEYGLQGEGYLYVLEKDEAGVLHSVITIDYHDNLFDVCWSEVEPNVLATAAGDGFVQIWNLGGKYPKVAVHDFKGHKKEMSTVDWHLPKFSNALLAASWDGTVSTYDVTSPWPLLKMNVSELIVYEATWSPHSPNNFICVSSDGVMQLWDLNASKEKPQIFISASDNELLTCDWGKYDQHIVATAGSDAVIKGWDLRKYSLPIFQLEDHGHAIKKIKFSPFHPTIIGSASYDLSVRIHDYLRQDGSVEIIGHHSEFVYGLDWNLHVKNELASCSWDQTVKLAVPLCLRNS